MFCDRRIGPTSVSWCLLVPGAILTGLLAGCGSGIRDAAAFDAAIACFATAPASGSAALSCISPGVVMVGAHAATVTLQGAGIAMDASVLIDGAAHPYDFVNSSKVLVVLTAAELAAPGRHAFTVRNPQAAVSDAKTLLVSSGYNAFGDSITAGYGLAAPATQSYAALLSAALNVPVINSARGGDQACDVYPSQIYPSGTGFTSEPAALQSLMIGTNDVDAKGVGAYEAIFNGCAKAAMAWLGTPRQSRLMAGDARFAVTGGCTNAASAANFGGLACTAAGTITASLGTEGHSIYVWYTLSDTAAVASTFGVALDGAASGTFATRPAVPLNTLNGGHSSVGLIRLSAPAGAHTVTITTATGGIGIQAVGSNPMAGTGLPCMLVGELPNQLGGSQIASGTDQAAYLADIRDNVSLLLSDGIDIRLAPTRQFMLGTGAEMLDALHPNVLGQQHLEAAFLSALR